MHNHTFTPRDRVRAYPSGRIGTVVGVDDLTAANYPGFTHLQYDGDEGTSLCDTQKLVLLDRAIELESFSDEQIQAELALRTIQPPAGFRTETFMECGRDGYDPCEPYGECDHEKDITFRGPGYYAADDWRVSTQWTPERGIFYILQHDGLGIWTPEEIEELPKALESVTRENGNASAIRYMRLNPQIDLMKMTIADVADLAREAGVCASQVMHAWTVIRNEQTGAGK